MIEDSPYITGFFMNFELLPILTDYGDKQFTRLVQDHPMIIPAKSQFNWFGGFWQEDFQGFNQYTLLVEDQFQPEHVIGRGPFNEHLWQVWLKSIQRFQRRRVECEKLTDGRTTDAYPWQKLTWPMARWAKEKSRLALIWLK